MNRTGDNVGYANISDAEIVELPYKGGRFSMLVLLPDKKSDIETLENSLSAEQLGKWTAAMTPRKVKINLPKFKQENDYDLAQTLAEMGMPSAFSPGSADFSGITGMDDIYISNIIHKTFIEVAEEGTEAAAATAVIMMRTSMPGPRRRHGRLPRRTPLHLPDQRQRNRRDTLHRQIRKAVERSHKKTGEP